MQQDRSDNSAKHAADESDILKLKHSEELFRSIIEQSPVATCLFVGRELRIEIANAPMITVMGKGKSVLGRPLAEALPEMKGQPFLEILDNAYTTGETFKASGVPATLIVDGKEELHYFDYTFKPVRNIEGEIFAILDISADVTEQVLAKKAIEESETRFRELANTLPIVVWTAGTDGGLTFITKQWEDFYGNPIDQSLGNGWAAFVHPDDVEAAATRWAHSLTTGENYETEFRVRHKQAGYRRVLVRAVPKRDADGRIINWYGSNTDIEHSRQAEATLLQSEKQFRILAETLPQMIWASDDKGVVEYHSGKWKEYSGKENSTDAWNYMIHPDDVRIATDAYDKSFSAGLPFKSEVRLKNLNGEYRWHSTFAEPVKNDRGELEKWVGVLTDVHEQKTAAERMTQLVNERTKELQRSNEDLLQFAHVASHDLKEPLRKIMTFGNLLKTEFGGEMPGKAEDYLSRMESATARRQVMIEGVLKYSSVEAPQQMTERVNLNTTLNDIRTDLDVLINKMNGKLTVSELPVLFGSEILLYQLFYNLIYNSLKFAKKDVPPEIRIDHGKANGEELIINVSDNGIGFPAHEAEGIFTTFRRLHSKDKYEGTGLGLSLCRKIVERHGGSISATGRPNNGATFTIIFPQARV